MKNLSVYVQSARRRGDSVPTSDGFPNRWSRAIHLSVTRTVLNGLTESFMIIYEEVKNLGSTEGWDGGIIHIYFCNIIFYRKERRTPKILKKKTA